MKSAFRWILIVFPFALVEGQTATSDPAGVLSPFAVARFNGSGAQSIQSMASDTAGNLYVAGTTTSPDFPVKNAAQSSMGGPGLMRSLDRGATWQSIPIPPISLLTMTPSPRDPQTLFLGAADGIYKTSDGGKTWRHVLTWYSSSAAAGNIAIDPASPLNVYVYLWPYYQFFASSDGGESWEQRSIPGNPIPASLFLWIDPNGSGTLGLGTLLSRDRGVHWSGMSALPAGSWGFTAPDPTHQGWIYAATGPGASGSLYLSLDWGRDRRAGRRSSRSWGIRFPAP